MDLAVNSLKQLRGKHEITCLSKLLSYPLLSFSHQEWEFDATSLSKSTHQPLLDFAVGVQLEIHVEPLRPIIEVLNGIFKVCHEINALH